MLITPDNVLDLDLNDLIKCVPEDFGNVIPVKKRIAFAQMLYNVLGHELDNDGLLFTVSEPEVMICNATAGSGKTTSSQKKLVLEKIYRKNPDGSRLEGDRILCLVYNRHNIQPMKDAHIKIVNKLYSCTTDLDIDRNINACTLHSFCDSWKNSYLAKCNMLNCSLLNDYSLHSIMRNCLIKLCSKYNLEEREVIIKIDDMISLYSFMCERLFTVDDLEEEDNFLKLGFPLDYVRECFDLYDSMKNIKRGYEYIDLLKCINDLLEKDEAVRTRIQNYYQYIVVDEIQDFTPLMLSIVKKIKGPTVPLLCIGDDDQSIYSFKGATVDCIKSFDELFPNNKSLFLLKNRRCPKNIVDMANKVVSTCHGRLSRNIYSTNEDGIIKINNYHSLEGQISLIINKLKSMTPEELNNTIICYRNKKSSLLLSNKLLEEDIDFNIISGYSPFSHELIKHFKSIYDMLAYPMDNVFIQNLYKVTPCTKKDIDKLLGYNLRTNRFSNSGRTCFYDLNFGDLDNLRDFKETIEVLKLMSTKMESVSMKDLYDGIKFLLVKYYWNYKKYINDNADIDNAFEKRCEDYFNVDVSYNVFCKNYDRDLETIKRNSRSKIGVTLSTFHGLKGLEVDNVIVMDLDEDIFPDFNTIDKICCGEDLKINLMNCETRLFYVVCTRAKKKIDFFCSDNPSCYINIVKEFVNNNNDKTKADSLDSLRDFSSIKCNGLKSETKDGNGIQLGSSLLNRFR